MWKQQTIGVREVKSSKALIIKVITKRFEKMKIKKIQKEKFGTNTSKDNLTLKYLKLNEI